MLFSCPLIEKYPQSTREHGYTHTLALSIHFNGFFNFPISMVTDLNYCCMCVRFVRARVAVWEPSPSRLCDDVTGAFQWASEGGDDNVEGLLFSHT